MPDRADGRDSAAGHDRADGRDFAAGHDRADGHDPSAASTNAPVVQGIRTVHTSCRLCTALCGVIVSVEGERVVAVTGDRDHPISEGYMCSKGRALPAWHHAPDRLDRPLLDGAEASWDEMLDDLAARLRPIIAEHGPDAVAAYRSAGWAVDTNCRSVSDSFFRALGTKHMYSSITLDTPNKRLVPYLVAGSILVPMADWERTPLLLLVGTNPIVSHGHAVARPNALQAMRAVKERGGVIVTVDPRVTESAQMADLHVQLRPGSDPALLAFLVREVIAVGGDHAYLEATTDPESLQRLTEAVQPYDLELAAALCDVPVEVLSQLREIVLRQGRLSFQSGTGVSMGAGPNVAEWLGWALAAVTGSLDRPGGTVFGPGVLRPQEHRPVTGPVLSGTVDDELMYAFGDRPSADLADEILAGNVRALFVVGGNPALVFPDSKKTRAALQALDVLAVIEVCRTETTDIATHLLPVAGQLERSDLPVFGDVTFPVPFTQYARQVVPIGGDRRRAWTLFAELAQRLNVPLRFKPEDDDAELLAAAASRSRIPYQEILEAPSGLLDPNAPEPGWLIPQLLTRPLDVAPMPLLAQFAAWRRDLGDETGLVLLTRRLPRQMNSTLRNVASQLRAPHPTLLVHPDDAADNHLADGSTATVTTAHGSTRATVEVSGSVRRGVVSMPPGWQEPDVNMLTSDSDSIDSLTGMPRFTGFSVTVETLAAGA